MSILLFSLVLMCSSTEFQIPVPSLAIYQPFQGLFLFSSAILKFNTETKTFINVSGAEVNIKIA